MGQKSRKPVEGLTLVELMVVLAVMGVLVSAALPSMREGFADRRVAMVARDVVSLFRRARYMSLAYGRAHQVVYANDSGTGLTNDAWAFETRRGTGGACSLTTYENGSFDLDNLDCGGNWRCVDFLYGNTYDTDASDNELVRVDGWDASTFCYEAGSNNQVFIDTALYSNWQTGTARAGFGFVVYREVGGNAFGVARKVLVPMGTGTPRILQ
ncbi:MAG: prepilin-type N-terminal cleavage/methylation domain-containing protein [Myxococcales bacterium]|nr:MAG: prepilin-type N-terminal cleavage/methylation domain-containing protein [Myxococcales bacterium]